MSNPKNLGDVYYEREHTEWYWRALGTVSASVILLGFLIFPKAFASPDKDPQTLVPLSIVAVVFLALGYSLSVALWFTCRSWLFQFDVLFLPCLCSCVLGAINVGINIAIPSSDLGIPWSTAPISALSLALASTTIYAILCAVTYAKIRRARQQSVSAGGAGDQDANTKREREAAEDTQRKAWAQLLSHKSAFNQSRYDTTTYRIDIPDHVRLGTKGDPDVPRRANSTWSSSQASSSHSLEGATMTNFSSESADVVPPSPLPTKASSLTPNAAALQEARERALARSRRDNRALGTEFPRELASSEAQSPSTPITNTHKPAQYAGAVYRPTSESVYSPSPEYEVVTMGTYLQSDHPPRSPREELDTRMPVPPQHWV